MSFKESEKNILLEAKYIGPTVIQRLEEIGIHSLRDLAEYSSEEVINAVSEMLGSTCWGNSHQAKKAIDNAIAVAVEFMS